MKRALTLLCWLALVVSAAPAGPPARVTVGRQLDGTFVLATSQRVDPGTFPIHGRAFDFSMHPDGKRAAILCHREIALLSLDKGKAFYVPLHGVAGFHGCVRSPDGSRLYVSAANNTVEERALATPFFPSRVFDMATLTGKPRPCPGGLAITRDGRLLLVCCANLSAVVAIDLQTGRVAKRWPVQSIPYEVKLTPDERTIVVSNWGGRPAEGNEETAESGGIWLVVDRRGVAATGSVTVIDRDDDSTTNVPVGLHPCGLAVTRDRAWVANAGSDSITEISLDNGTVTRTIPIQWGSRRLFGSMPNALAVRGERLYSCNGGDNALCEMDLRTGRVLGFRPAGFFPLAMALSPDGTKAYVLNGKGNGSVTRTTRGRPGNVHQFQATLSVIDLRADLRAATARVAAHNSWAAARAAPPRLAVYNGAIRHVLYIIKENRTYDEVFGDVSAGNGDRRLCGLGEAITPNHHALAREFALFDNAYVMGTNSADGHQWAMEALANDYVERFQASYTRSFPFDGGDPMAYSSGGFIWNTAVSRGRTVRVYGEFCARSLARIEPQPKDWQEVWNDRLAWPHRFRIRAGTTVASLRPHVHPRVLCWPLLVSDQWRADEFIREYRSMSRRDRVPSLMILTLPADHTMGLYPGYPTPRAMVADNDLALGRVVDAVSHSPQWKDTCIFVIEDDAQFGVDHVDGHRTICLAASPYLRRGFVDSTFYTQASVLRSIELMLGLPPMTRFDALANPLTACFADTPDMRPYTSVPNGVSLTEINPPRPGRPGAARRWTDASLALDWGEADSADWRTLNRIVWYSLHGSEPYPGG